MIIEGVDIGDIQNPATSLAFLLFDNDGEGIPGANVYLFRDDGTLPSKSGITNDDGAFVFTDVGQDEEWALFERLTVREVDDGVTTSSELLELIDIRWLHVDDFRVDSDLRYAVVHYQPCRVSDLLNDLETDILAQADVKDAAVLQQAQAADVALKADVLAEADTMDAAVLQQALAADTVLKADVLAEADIMDAAILQQALAADVTLKADVLAEANAMDAAILQQAEAADVALKTDLQQQIDDLDTKLRNLITQASPLAGILNVPGLSG